MTGALYAQRAGVMPVTVAKAFNAIVDGFLTDPRNDQVQAQ